MNNNHSFYDRIDDLDAEIRRLRALLIRARKQLYAEIPSFNERRELVDEIDRELAGEEYDQ